MRRLGALALAGLIALAAAPPAGADLASDLAEVRARIQVLRAQAGESRSARSDAANRVLDAAAELETLVAQLREAERLLAEAERSITATHAEIEALRERVARRQALVARLRAQEEDIRQSAMERAVEIYMSTHAHSWTPFMGSALAEAGVGLVYAGHVQEFADGAIRNYQALHLEEGRQLALLEAERVSLESLAAALERHREEQRLRASEAAARRLQVEATLAEQRDRLAAIDAEIAAIEIQIDSLAREESRIREVLAREQSPGGTSPGSLYRPVPGAVSSPYGYRIHPVYGDRRLHTGWDMNGGCGQPIAAAGSGRVIHAGWRGGYGNTVIIDHGGGMATLYAHQSSLGVKYGQQVGTGQVIGRVGTTGLSTSCHLHFEVRISGTPVDPFPYF